MCSGSFLPRIAVLTLVTIGFGFIQYRPIQAGVTSPSTSALRSAEDSPRPSVLSFANRVAYQRKIEEVYWQHRIWPKERSEPKPSLDEVMLPSEIKEKVQEYLRKSEWLKDNGGMTLTQGQLQAEVDRMIQHTKQPEILRQVFQALGNDPYVIAECLARPVLVEHLVNNLSARDKTRRGPVEYSAAKVKAEVSAADAVPISENTIAPTASVANFECSDDMWNPLVRPTLQVAGVVTLLFGSAAK